MLPRIASLGHEVAVSAFCGLSGARTSWHGITVYPGGFSPVGDDVIAGHAADFRADLVITLMDIFALRPQVMKDLGAVHWMPVDCEPLGQGDKIALRESGAQPIAFSEFGRHQLSEAGFSPLYVPHGIDTQVFCPGDRAAARERMGLPEDAFVIGMNAANVDDRRKGWFEQMAAFGFFREKHPDAVLLAHTIAPGPGQNLSGLADFFGIGHAVRWSDRYKYSTGGFSARDMALWYAALDVYSGASWAEGFGLPLAEAQACGIPVVATRGSAMTEVTGAGWLVDGEPAWKEGHYAQWCKPRIGDLTDAYEAAYNGAHATGMAGKARSHAMRYDADSLLPEWDRILKILEART